VLVGDGMIGKTTLLISYTSGAFPQTEYVPTIFDNYNSIEECDGQKVNLILWDTAGQEDLARIRTLNYKGTDCFIVCYSVFSRNSYENVKEKWIPEIMNHVKKPNWILVGLKCDLFSDESNLRRLREDKKMPVTTEEGEKLARQMRALAHLQCSALHGLRVKDVFLTAMKSVLQKQKKK